MAPYRNHHLALDRPGQIGEVFILFDRKRGAVPGGGPVGRVTVEQRVRPVVSLDAIDPRQMLDQHQCQAQVGRRKFPPGEKE